MSAEKLVTAMQWREMKNKNILSSIEIGLTVLGTRLMTQEDIAHQLAILEQAAREVRQRVVDKKLFFK